MARITARAVITRALLVMNLCKLHGGESVKTRADNVTPAISIIAPVDLSLDAAEQVRLLLDSPIAKGKNAALKVDA